MNKKFLTIYSIILVVLTASLTFSATLMLNGNGRLIQVQKILENHYYEDIDKQALTDGAIRGMAASLDPWTSYMNPTEFNQFTTLMSGSYAGVGIFIQADPNDNYVTVVAPIENSPAEAAGIVGGDKIIKVDGEEVFADQIDLAAAKMKGPPGTETTLTVLKSGATETIEIPITRANIIMKTVKSEMKPNNIGYISISSFDEKTSTEFKEHLETLKTQGMKSLIIDLRNNPGGIVTTTEEIANIFLESDQTIYSLSGKYQKPKTERATGEAYNIPIVVLINGDSASASEILTGALKDNGKAIIVGEKSYGKGVMQQLLPMQDGGAIKVTIAKYFTPNGTDIDKVGIDPDHIIEGEQAQLQKALELLK